MTTSPTTDLYTQFATLVEAGDEDATRLFLVENINAFPENLKEELVMALFEGALLEKKEKQDALLAFTEKVKTALTDLTNEEKKLEEGLRIIDIRTDLSA